MRRAGIWALLCVLLLGGCGAGGAEEKCRRELLAMDTVMTLTIYGQPEEKGQEILQQAAGRILELERLLSVTAEGSDIYRVNHSGGAAVDVSEDAGRLLSEALALCADTEGALDVTVYPVVKAWGFTTGNYRVPGEEELDGLLEKVDYRRASLDGRRAALPEGMELDLGAVAKGYAGDELMALFAQAGVTSAIVELGGNVQALGAKPDGSPWRVAVQAPEGGYAGVLEVVDKAVITSGGYQRFFEEDGEVYWHIIDPASGKPARSGLASVTVVAESGVEGDGLSTALFVMGKEKAAEYWRGRQDFDCVFLGEDGSVAITQGLEECFSLYGRWGGRTVEVLRPGA